MRLQAIILAAGMGRRLGELTRSRAKCMVQVCGKTLIERQLNSLSELGIKKAVIVVGYEADGIRNLIGNEFKGMEIIYVFNEKYAITNNIYSLWLARNYLIQEDTILLESDIIFDKSLLSRIVSSEHDNVVAVAKYEPWMDGTVTLVDEKDKVIAFVNKTGFRWEYVNNYFKTINIYKFSSEFSRKAYLPFLNAYIETVGENEYYEEVLRVVTYLDHWDLMAEKVVSESWYEIDTAEDLEIAQAIFAPEKYKLDLLHDRYGGYWRFSSIKDFALLVNPAFPPKELVEEMRYSFDQLLTSYPSARSNQSLLAGKVFGCSPSNIIVGNGASELIAFILDYIQGKAGIPVPTFDEYINRLPADRVVLLNSESKDFSFTPDELKKLAEGKELLVLVNPCNPTGTFFKQKDIIEVIEYTHELGIFVIVDESFVDFADKDMFTLINDDVLKKYPGLVVIKSLGKSFGIPGIRLGVAATTNRNLKQAIKSNLPIWNINSIAEYFLQIIDKYLDSYRYACLSVARQRDLMIDKLNELDYLKCRPSKGNFVFAEIGDQITANELARYLLTKGILVKDCSTKLGISGRGEFIRFAVKNSEENRFLLQCLEQFKNQTV